MAKPGRKTPAGKTRRQVLEELDMSHSESEDERLGKALDGKGAGQETDDDMEEEEVMGMDGSDDEDEEESDEGEEGDDDLDEDELDDSDAEHDARLAKLAKKMEHRVKLQQAGSDEEGEEDGDEDDGTAAWSKRKQDYYGADVADPEAESDEELLKEEEQEVERLEARRAAGLTNRDFELSGSGSSDDEESEDEQEGGARGGKAGARQMEVVEKELGLLTSEERRAAVQRDAPELEALLEELRGALREVRHRVGPLLQEVRGGEVATQQGVSYLEAKHLLLLQYCAAIVFYLLLKAEGRPVRDHPVVLRLVALRGYLEKIRPIDRKLQHQMQKLLQAARVAQDQEGGGAEEGAEEAGAKEQDFGPRPDLLVPKVAGAAGEEAANGTAGANGVYRPPKINPVAMDDDPDKPSLSRDDRRRLVLARRRAARSQLVQELVEELEGAPEEQRTMVAGMESVAALRQRQRLEARAAEEEELFTRVPLSKEELKKLKANRRAGLSGAALMDDFADEVNDLVEMAGASGKGGRSGLADLFQRHKVSQKYGADLTDDTRAARNKSGDADLPERAPLHERRAKFDSLAARRSAAADGFGSDGGFDEYDAEGGRGRSGKRGREGEEDEFYAAAAEAARARKEARREAQDGAGMVAVPAEDERVGSARKISREIEKNRGLTPHRRKDIKNPRKKNRIKYGKAVVRRKGQVQDVRSGSSGYGGEATGIKARVSKSRKL